MVNTHTTSDQRYPAVAAEGDFLVVWASAGQDGSASGIFGQRLDGTGTPVGSEFLVNTHTPADQTSPAVARDSMGGFIVVWESDGQDGSANGIFGQRYNASGTAVGIEFVVNTYTTGDQSDPAIAVDASGDFVVVWTSDAQDGGANGVFGQRYDATGVLAGGEFQVNTHTTADQQNPGVATDGSGDFVVTWESPGQDGSNGGIFARRYACAGSCTGGDGCCPAGCHFTNDADCPNSGPICKDKKSNYLGKHTLAIAKAFGQNAKSPNSGRLTSDISRAKSKLTRRFTKAEFSGSGVSRDCFTTGDAGPLGDKVDILVEDALDELEP